MISRLYVAIGDGVKYKSGMRSNKKKNVVLVIFKYKYEAFKYIKYNSLSYTNTIIYLTIYKKSDKGRRMFLPFIQERAQLSGMGGGIGQEVKFTKKNI